MLGSFAAWQGVWGPEAATITGVDGGVTPAQGANMLRITDTGSYSQTFQVTDVTSLAGVIDSGGATVNMSALFNVDKNVQAALGGVSVSFFTTSNYGSLTGFTVNSLTLDSAPNTWQPISTSTAIPVGTRWLLTQVFYKDSTLLGIDGVQSPGYVDAAELNVVPEPATLAILAIGSLAIRRKRSLC